LAEWETVKLPATSRSNLTQHGAVNPVWFVLKLVASVSMRPWKATPFAGVTHPRACFEPASSVSRIITPAFAQPLVFCTLRTRAVMEPAPVSVFRSSCTCRPGLP